MSETVNCPGCGMKIELADAEEKAEQDADATLTCPTCGAGFERDGTPVHDPAIGP
jgi:endogenous inhibitor of DNA gyrase (YacG/DUF329 family)